MADAMPLALTSADAWFLQPPPPSANDFADHIVAILDQMSAVERQVVMDRVRRAFGREGAVRVKSPGTLLRDNLSKRSTWTSADVIGLCCGAGIEVSKDAAHAALGYLCRNGRLERIGHGRYRPVEATHGG